LFQVIVDSAILPRNIELSIDVDQVLKLNEGILMHGMAFVKNIIRQKAKEYDIEMNDDLRQVVDAIPIRDPSRSTLLHSINVSKQRRVVSESIKVLIQSQASIELFVHTALSLISSFSTGGTEITDVLMYLVAGYSILERFDDSELRDDFTRAFGDDQVSDGWDIDELPDELSDEGLSGREKSELIFGVLERVSGARDGLQDYRYESKVYLIEYRDLVVDGEYESLVVQVFKEVIGSGKRSRDLMKQGGDGGGVQETALDSLLLGILGGTAESASHPSQFQTIIFYVDGGVTLREVKEMKEALMGCEDCADMEVVFAASGIVDVGELVQGLFRQVM
jgi:hypothetical protein